MRKAFMLAWREMKDQYSDRASIVRAVFLAALPIVLVQINRGAARGPDTLIIVFALQAALLPAATAINSAAGSFAAEKEAQTIVPLLAAPIGDIEIVAGKLIGVLVPAAAISALSLTGYYAMASATFGATRVEHVLDPLTLAELFGLSVFFILTIGSWVMVVSARVASQRAAQQVAGLFLAATIIGLTALSTVIGTPPMEVVIGIAIAILLSDLVALELARRLWDREEAVARL